MQCSHPAEKSPAGRRRTKFMSISFVRQIRLPRFGGEANLPPELLATHLVVRPSKTCERLPCANLAYNPHCAHIAPTLRPHCAHIAPTLRRSNFPRVQLCIPDRWSGLGLRRAFGAFSALKGRTSIQPGFVLKARPWQRRGADIRMFSGTRKFCLDALLVVRNFWRNGGRRSIDQNLQSPFFFFYRSSFFTDFRADSGLS